MGEERTLPSVSAESRTGSQLIGTGVNIFGDALTNLFQSGVFGDSEVGQNIGSMFGSSLGSITNTVSGNIIRGTSLLEGLGKNAGASIGGAASGIAGRYIGQGISSAFGNSSVGKTSLLLRYCGKKFNEDQISTIGVDFVDKTITYRDMKINLHIWDTSGQERFRSLAQNFYRNADGIMFVFDLECPDSFEDIRHWLNETEEYSQDFKKILVGNKMDLEHKVNRDRIDPFADKRNIKYFETSAKEGTNVNEVFESLVEEILGNKTEEEIKRMFNLDKQKFVTQLSKPAPTEVKKKKCCK